MQKVSETLCGKIYFITFQSQDILFSSSLICLRMGRKIQLCLNIRSIFITRPKTSLRNESNKPRGQR